MAKYSRCDRCGCKIEQKEGVSVKFVAQVKRIVNHRPIWVWDKYDDAEKAHGHWAEWDEPANKHPTTIESFMLCKSCAEQTIQFIIKQVR